VIAEFAKVDNTALYPTVSAADVLADWDAWHYRKTGYEMRRDVLEWSARQAEESLKYLEGYEKEDAEAELASLRKQLTALPEDGPPGGWPPVLLGDPASLAKDKVVFIAGTAAALSDRHRTPWSPVTPGTFVLANSFDNFANEDFLRATPRWAEWLAGLGACVLAVLAVMFSRTTRGGAVRVAALVVIVCAASWIGFEVQWWVPTAVPLAGLFIGFSNGALAKALTEGRQRRQREAFARQYMGRELLDFVIHNPDSLKLGGQNSEMTVYFSDVAGFTTVSETLGPNNPERLVELLNIYLERMTDLMLETGAVIDKYIGDALMCFWGAPMDMQDHAVRACRGALACRAELQRMQPLFADSVRQIAPQLIKPDGSVLSARAGINSGLMTVGNMGSSKRFAYTVMGDAVNLGARLEPQCKEYGVDMLIGENTEGMVRSEFTIRPIDLIVVAGKTKPVEVFELIGGKEVPQFITDLLKHYNAGLQLFRDREFEQALASFRNAAQHEPVQDEGKLNPSRLYIERCNQLMKEPPPKDWNTVYVKRKK
jgi:adenylate cyclase